MLDENPPSHSNAPEIAPAPRRNLKPLPDLLPHPTPRARFPQPLLSPPGRRRTQWRQSLLPRRRRSKSRRLRRASRRG